MRPLLALLLRAPNADTNDNAVVAPLSAPPTLGRYSADGGTRTPPPPRSPMESALNCSPSRRASNDVVNVGEGWRAQNPFVYALLFVFSYYSVLRRRCKPTPMRGRRGRARRSSSVRRRRCRCRRPSRATHLASTTTATTHSPSRRCAECERTSVEGASMRFYAPFAPSKTPPRCRRIGRWRALRIVAPNFSVRSFLGTFPSYMPSSGV